MFGQSLKRRWHVLMLSLLTLAMVLPGLASLPVIDRDEARYAQASVQMAESGDLLNIRFQDEARNKKPAGVYWLQTAMIKTFAQDGERKIWAQRLPSVFGALMTILFLYWGGLKMVGRDAAFIGSALLAVSLVFVFEGHIAKTDALLCASTTAVFAALGRLRNGVGKLEPWVFWIGLGLSIIIKGPIGLVLVVLSLTSLLIWERSLSWAKPLLNIGAIVVFVLLWLPWAVAIFIATDGAFFVESLGNDLGGKVVSAQENHGAPPGTHLAVIALTLWPASLFLLPGLVYAVKAVRSGGGGTVPRAMRYCLAWAVPFWVLIEIMPTKLPHYALPVFPALCLMMGAAILAMHHLGDFAKSRIINGCLFILASAGVVAGLLFVQVQYGEYYRETLTFAICLMGGLIAIVGAFAVLLGKIRTGFFSVLLSALILSGGAYGYILPKLDNFRTSEFLANEIKTLAPNISSKDIHSPHYSEPSLVYHVGSEIDVTARQTDLSRDRLVVLDVNRNDFEIRQADVFSQGTKKICVTEFIPPVTGFNYSKGDEVTLVILRAAPCGD
ncbi:ArnT family glycosyltransferase [Litorimonas sp. WD9-15]|uniref:ArnT family glycosyltransferase n=1 Tax=Litorimonas sp. WD9-15 TaxID=3418716 RepID=UPI003D0843C8